MESEKMRSARDIQQEYFEAFGDRDWDEYESENLIYLKYKIAYAMFGEPHEEGDFFDVHTNPTMGYSDKEFQRILPIYEKVVQHGCYSADGKKVYMSVLFVCCVPEDKRAKSNIHLYDQLDCENIHVSPVFKIRRCIKLDNSDENPGCVTFLDDLGREYVNWQLYLENNKLPKGVIVAPLHGRYHGVIIDENVSVYVEVVWSPASSVLAMVRDVGDTAGTTVAVAALGIMGFSLFAPVAAPVMGALAVASLTVGGYGTAVSTAHLRDRQLHGQSINLQDPEARSAWINLAASTTGLAAGASTKILTKAVSNGAIIGRGFQVAHDAAVVAAALTSGAGLVNGIVNCVLRYKDTGEAPTKLELFQLASSAFFLGNTIMTNRMASTIIEETQASQINNYRSSLRSNRHRKIFDKMVAETRRSNGDIRQGSADVIRSINRIENRDQFFQDALRVNKQLNQNNVKISFSRDGQALLNGEHMMNPQSFYNMEPAARQAYLERIGPSTLSVSNVSTGPTPEVQTSNLPGTLAMTTKTLISVARMTSSFPEFCGSQEDLLRYAALQLTKFSEATYEYFARLLNCFYHQISAEVFEKLYAMGFNDTKLFFKLFSYLYDYLKTQAGCESKIPDVLNTFFATGRIDHDYLYDLLKEFSDFVKTEFVRVTTQSDAQRKEHRCEVCGGITFQKK